MPRLRLPIPTEAIGQFCRRWKIRELAVFGSALREDFSPKAMSIFWSIFMRMPTGVYGTTSKCSKSFRKFFKETWI